MWDHQTITEEPLIRPIKIVYIPVRVTFSIAYFLLGLIDLDIRCILNAILAYLHQTQVGQYHLLDLRLT